MDDIHPRDWNVHRLQTKPTVGFDEYFCNETARPRDDLATLLTSLGQLGLPELNRSHASASQLLRAPRNKQ